MGFEFEPIIILLNFYDLAIGCIERAVGVAVFLGQEGFFLRGIKSFVSLLLKFSSNLEFGQDGLNELLVPGAGSADKIVVGEFELLRKRLPIGGETVAVILGRFAIGLRGLLYFLAVFVETGKIENFLPETATGAGNHVSDDLLVGVAEVRLAIDIINGGGDVKRFAHPVRVWRRSARMAIARSFFLKNQSRR